MDKKIYRAVVQKVVLARESQGKHERGPYVVTRCERFDDSVTFSLDKDTWSESESPKPGTIVLLSKIVKKRAGWRANSVRLLEPADEQKAKSKQKGAS